MGRIRRREQDGPAEVVDVCVEEGETGGLGGVGGVGALGRRVEGVIDVEELIRGRGWELGGQEGVEGGLGVAGWRDEEAGFVRVVAGHDAEVRHMAAGDVEAGGQVGDEVAVDKGAEVRG